MPGTSDSGSSSSQLSSGGSSDDESGESKKRGRDSKTLPSGDPRKSSKKEDRAAPASASDEDSDSMSEGSDSEDVADDIDGDKKEQSAKRQGEEVGRKQAIARVRQRLPVVPIVQASNQELAQLLNKLNSDGEEQLEALKAFEENARAAIACRETGGGDGAVFIHAYFKGSPECSELFRVLAKGAAGGDKVRDSGKMNALMRLFQALLSCHVVPLLLEHSRNLGTKIIRKANKAFIGAITSGKTRLFAETMRVISCASELGVVQARDAWKKFSPYLKNMTRHLEVMKMEDKKNKEGPRVERPFAREARAAVIQWGIVLLRVGDTQLIAPVLGTSTFLPAALKHIGSDPPELVVSLLDVIISKVLGSSELSFPIRAALFPAFNLEILAGLLRRGDVSPPSTSEAPNDPGKADMVREKVLVVLRAFCGEVLSSSTERAGAANVRLLLPLATSLRPSDDVPQQVTSSVKRGLGNTKEWLLTFTQLTFTQLPYAAGPAGHIAQEAPAPSGDNVSDLSMERERERAWILICSQRPCRAHTLWRARCRSRRRPRISFSPPPPSWPKCWRSYPVRLAQMPI